MVSREPGAPFNFRPLSSDHEIRLLHLDARADIASPLFGRLEHATLEEDIRYEALSYEWGDPTRLYPLLLQDGIVMKVTKSLYCALRDLRPVDENGPPRVLWADAICINQDSRGEVERQVGFMDLIYRKATRVVTYIGPEKDASSEAIHFASSLVGKPGSKPDLASLPPLSDSRWEALSKLILRSWASRCWCALEFSLNENLTVVCGRTVLPKSHMIGVIVTHVVFHRVPQFIPPGDLEDNSSVKECVTSMQRFRSNTRGAQLPLLDLLAIFHPFKATDPRDKVYSVLSFAREEDRRAIPIDYSCAVEDLYIKVATRLVREPNNLDILGSNLLKKSLKLPSWVPDWSTWQYGSYGTSVRENHWASVRVPRVLRVNDSNNTMDVSGSIVDQITSLSDDIGKYYLGRGDEETEQRRQFMRGQESVAAELQPYAGRTTPADIVWTTLTGGLDLEGDRAPSTYRAFYDMHLLKIPETATDLRQMAQTFTSVARRTSRYRKFAVTDSGYFGATPQTCEPGDWIVRLDSEPLLCVLREAAEGYRYIGQAYVHGLAYGGVYTLHPRQSQVFTLV